MFRSLIVLGLLLPLALHGQSQPPPITTRILTYAPAGLPASFQTYFRTGQAVELFTASAGTLGLPIEYTGPQTFALYASKADMLPVPEGQKPKPPVATVTLPLNCDVVLLLCTRTAGEKVGLVAYNITSNDLKPGDYRVFNFSKSQTSMILGEQRFALAPGKDSMVRDSAWHGEVVAFPIKIATIVDGKPKTAYSSIQEHYPQRRNLMFLFDGHHPSRPITFVTFNADLPPPKPAATGSSGTAAPVPSPP
jgi:hypothetical protein